MRSAWLFTIGAALCVVTTTTRPATAAPSSMAWGAQPVASTSSDSWTEKLKFWHRDTPAAPVANRCAGGQADRLDLTLAAPDLVYVGRHF